MGQGVRKLATAVALAILLATRVGAQSLQARLPGCLACHGENGQSQLSEVPSLGAQPALYSLTELVMFRDKLRIAPPMNDMANGLSDNDLRWGADFFAGLPPPMPVAGPAEPARMERGRMLATQNRCNFCHQTSFQGERNVPRLAGQREDYLLKSLRAYKNNSRRGYDAQMAEVVYGMTDEEFVELAYYLARVK